jgi:hypothetical protein
MQSLGSDKHSSLLQSIINCVSKNFFDASMKFSTFFYKPTLLTMNKLERLSLPGTTALA